MLTRPTINKVFGSTALESELTIFGKSTTSTDVNLIMNSAEAQRGWGVVGVNGFPPMEWFNSLGYGLSYQTAYLLQQGIPSWSALQDYYIGAYAVGSNGYLYKSLTGVNGTPNIGNNPTTDTTNWIDAFKSQIPFAINGSPAKTTLVENDILPIADSASSFSLKKITWANFKAGLATTAFVSDGLALKADKIYSKAATKGWIDPIVSFNNTASVTGAIQIQMPMTTPNGTMISAKIVIENLGERTEEIDICFYYNTGTPTIYGQKATSTKDYAISFSADGKIIIGDVTNIWKYPKISITPSIRYNGHTNPLWQNDWGVSYITALPTIFTAITPRIVAFADNVVNLTTAQTVAGAKNFTTNPTSSAPQSTEISALTRKDYVDTKIASSIKMYTTPLLETTPTTGTIEITHGLNSANVTVEAILVVQAGVAIGQEFNGDCLTTGVGWAGYRNIAPVVCIPNGLNAVTVKVNINTNLGYVVARDGTTLLLGHSNGATNPCKIKLIIRG